MSVEIGQVYSETDPRQAGRTVEVMEIVGVVGAAYAIVRLNTPARNVGKNAIGRKTRIRVDRLDGGQDYELSDVEPYRFGTHRETGEIGYYPRSELRG